MEAGDGGGVGEGGGAGDEAAVGVNKTFSRFCRVWRVLDVGGFRFLG